MCATALLAGLQATTALTRNAQRQSDALLAQVNAAVADKREAFLFCNSYLPGNRVRHNR